MAAGLILAVTNRFPLLRRRLFGWFFDLVAVSSRNMDSWTFMNYGYAPLDDDLEALALESRDEPERYCIHLYRHAMRDVELQDKDVVEVSSGRGGGAALIARCLGAKTTTGIDFSAEQIAFCRRIHCLPNLTFLQGDAEELPLGDACADVVVNIEASCLYPNPGKFFAEVARILRPDGRFVYADLHLAQDVDSILGQLDDAGLRILRSEDITANVAQALRMDNGRRLGTLRAHAPWGLRRVLEVFCGTQGTLIPASLANGRLVYASYLLAPAKQEVRCPAERAQATGNFAA